MSNIIRSQIAVLPEPTIRDCPPDNTIPVIDLNTLLSMASSIEQDLKTIRQQNQSNKSIMTGFFSSCLPPK